MHYGVLGMRWGFRKAPQSGSDERRGLFGRKQKIRPEEEQVKQKPSEERDVSELTDEEIKTRLARLSLEKQYTEATQKPKEDPNSRLKAEVDRLQLKAKRKELLREIRRGRTFTLKVLEQIGEKTLVNVGTQAAVKGLGLAINKKFNVDPYDTEKRIVNPNKGQADKK